MKAEETLLPFIVSGLERGERALHIVDPARRTTYLQRLTNAGIDVQRALDTGQLEVPGWDSVYLSGGRFDRAAVLTFIQEALAAGRSRGFPLTRVIGYMEWTLQRVPGVEDLLIYESEVDVAFRGVADPLICVYDLERHPAGLILQVLAAHQLGIVEGGVLSQETREITIEALPGDIPDSIKHDVSALEMNATLTLDALTAPAGVTVIDDAETVIATITPPTVEPVEEEIETETELVGEGEAAEGEEGEAPAEEPAAESEES
jgi:hypothetical protein